MNLNWPLMENNIQQEDKSALGQFLGFHEDYPYKVPVPRLTQGPQIESFEEEFSAWLGVKHSVMVNSGASANLITMAALRSLAGPGEVMVPCITWVSDIAAVLHAGLTPRFVDVNPRTFGMDRGQAVSLLNGDTVGAFPTHCLGFDAHASSWQYRVPLVEDCCEAMGATHNGRKLGTFGLASNFSFYYGHHMTTIEGGMICTDNAEFYQACRMFRAHGLVREMTDATAKAKAAELSPDLDPEFIFCAPAWNCRSTEINAVLGRSQLKRFDEQNPNRTENLKRWLEALDASKFRIDYSVEGSSNFALPLVLNEKNPDLWQRIIRLLTEMGVEHRRGTAGGGNQLRQPYLKERFGEKYHEQFPNAEHIHEYGLYVGNYPTLESWKIEELCKALNALAEPSPILKRLMEDESCSTQTPKILRQM